MYRINPFQRPILIVADEVIVKIAAEGVPDLRILQNSIEVAEEKYIVPVMGSAFYEDFITKKNVTITAPNQAAMLTKINTSLTAAGIANITDAAIPVGTIINAIEEVTTDGYQDLWFRYLWRICTEAVDAMTTVPGWLRHTAQGQQKHNPAGFSIESKIATGNREDIQYKMDSIVQGRISPLVDRMREWIVARPSKFPLHPLVKTTSCGNKVTAAGRKAGIILNLYDDDQTSNYDADVNG